MEGNKERRLELELGELVEKARELQRELDGMKPEGSPGAGGSEDPGEMEDRGEHFPERKETLLIGVAGSKRGIGATHTAIALANYLREGKEGSRAAVMECNGSGDFKRIWESYDAPGDGDRFTYGEVDYYCDTDPERLDLSLQEDYDFLVLDLGTYEECHMGAFHSCDRRLVVTGGKAWEVEGVSEIFQAAGREDVGGYYFCFNFVPDDLVDVVKGGMGDLRTAFLEYMENPFEPPDRLLKQGDIPFGLGERRPAAERGGGKEEKKTGFFKRKRYGNR